MTTNVWDEVLSRAETKINRHSFYTWFKPTVFVGETDNEITVRVPNGLFRDWLTTHYAGVISEAVSDIGRDGIQITFVAAGDAASVEPPPVVPPPEAAADAPPAAPPAGFKPTLCLRYLRRWLFESVCPRRVASRGRGPVSVLQPPSFSMGGAGLGKTHLMHAIGQYLLKQTPHTKLTYISSERVHERDDQCRSVRQDFDVSRAISN